MWNFNLQKLFVFFNNFRKKKLSTKKKRSTKLSRNNFLELIFTKQFPETNHEGNVMKSLRIIVTYKTGRKIIWNRNENFSKGMITECGVDKHYLKILIIKSNIIQPDLYGVNFCIGSKCIFIESERRERERETNY